MNELHEQGWSFNIEHDPIKKLIYRGCYFSEDLYHKFINDSRLRKIIDNQIDSYQPERSKREDAFVYKPDNYPGPIALNATPSKECKEYHENSCIQINIENKTILK